MPGLPFAGRVAAGWREHTQYLAAAEELRVQQEAMARGGGFHVDDDDDGAAAAAAAVKRSALEEAAAASHHETIVQRVYRAVTTFDAAELRDMLTDFSSDHSANVNVAAGSLASAGVVGATVWKARCVGRLYDSLTGGAGGGLSALLAGGAAGAANVAPLDSAHAWRSHGALLVAVLGASLAEWALSVARDYSFGRARAARVVASRRRYLAAMLAQDMTFHAANNSAVLAQRLQSDPEALDDAAIYSLERLLRGVIALATAVVMIRADWPTFTLGVALRLPFALQFVEKSVAIVTAYERLQAHTLQRAQARAAEALGAVGAIQVHTAEDAEVDGYARLLGEHAAVTRRGAVAQAVLRQTEHLVVALSEFLTLAVRRRRGRGRGRRGRCGGGSGAAKLRDAAPDGTILVLPRSRRRRSALQFGAWRIYTGAMSLGAFTAYRSHMQVVIDEFNRCVRTSQRVARAAPRGTSSRSLCGI
jgi:ABC-type multidrug transport system fused ATPase/permease subunit